MWENTNSMKHPTRDLDTRQEMPEFPFFRQKIGAGMRIRHTLARYAICDCNAAKLNRLNLAWIICDQTDPAQPE
jgi:hypothetical protein